MRYLAASLLVFSYLFFCWLCWRHYQRKQHIFRSSNIDSNEYILIGYASQTGSALHIAQQTATQLEQAGKSVQILPLNQITPAQLTQISTALFVVSTFGEGEAPDNGNRFFSHTLAQLEKTSLQHLHVAMLGLGDSTYQHFCGFAHHLYNKLRQCGAHFLTDIVEVDRLDESALRHWQYYLGQLSGNTHFSDWSKPAYEDWLLCARDCINPASPGAPAYHLKLKPATGDIPVGCWQAGDIAEIGPSNSLESIQIFLQRLGRSDIPSDLLLTRDLLINDEKVDLIKNLAGSELIDALPELPHREYSIASVPEEGALDLLVRQVRINEHQFGIGSGWLTKHAALDGLIRLRIRTNSHFHSPEATRPLILICNGTGIAGVRSHIANPARSQAKHWLFFGERSELADDFFQADLLKWQSTGLLARVDKVFSRDAQPNAPRYVQDLLLPNAEEIKQWVDAGAAIFVCGSLQGMAGAVDDALSQILGQEKLEWMAGQSRYCRDVY